MGKSEQTGGGGGGTETTPHKEPKPKQKRPWRKPRLMLIEMDFTRLGGPGSEYNQFEADLSPDATLTGGRYRSPTS